MAGWYPVMLNMDGKFCVVVGGGKVAERKIGGLLAAEARVRVVSPALTPGLRALADAGRIEWHAKEAQPEDLSTADFAFAAAGDALTNRRMAEAARAAGVPINLADDGEAGDFLLPAVVRRGGLLLAASTSGASPALTVRIARELALQYGPEYESRTEALWQMRKMAKTHVKDAKERRMLLRAAVSDEAWRCWRETDWLNNPQGWLAVLRRLAMVSQNREDEGENDA